VLLVVQGESLRRLLVSIASHSLALTQAENQNRHTDLAQLEVSSLRACGAKKPGHGREVETLGVALLDVVAQHYGGLFVGDELHGSFPSGVIEEGLYDRSSPAPFHGLLLVQPRKLTGQAVLDTGGCLRILRRGRS
jgi:hypothetical protein